MADFKLPVQNIPTPESAYANIIGKSDNQVVDIQNDLIIENNDQEFVIHEETVEQLSERIAKDGQLSPCIVTPLENGKYELIDGRHRRRAVIKAGIPTTKCIIRHDLDEKSKAAIRLTSNLIRNNDYLPSELAYAYKELAALENNDMSKISDETNQSKKKIYRYIRLTELIKPLLNRVDNGSIPLIAAVELSYLNDRQQKKLFEYLLNHSDCKINTVNARAIKDNPDDLDNVFYSDTDTDDTENESPVANDVVVDNLSTDETENVLSVTDDKEITVDDNGTVSLSSGCYDYLSSDERGMIAEFVISKTNADFYILRYAYTSQEVIKLFDEYYKNYVRGFGGDIEFDWHYRGNGKNLKLSYNDKNFIIPFKVLDEITRLYIRNEYTTDKIISVINQKIR